MMSSIDKEIIISTIAAMCEQEERGYRTSTYLHQSEPQNTSSPRGPLHSAEDPIDLDCRTKMIDWCYQVVDFCKFNRETVAIAINYLDRFVSGPAGSMERGNRKAFQLAAMTALYTAVKIHEPEAMDPKLVSTLSRNTYTPSQVEAMEARLLAGLSWLVNPPTAMAFVRQFLDLLPGHLIDPVQREVVYDLCKFQAETAISEHAALIVKPSIVGYCALLNALESVGVDDTILPSISRMLFEAINTPSGNIEKVQAWLCKSILGQPAMQRMILQNHFTGKSKESHSPRGDVSPRSVAAATYA